MKYSAGTEKREEKFNMSDHPIQGLMDTTMSNIKSMIDVNTIVGEPVTTDGTVIIPISTVSFGFAAGGTQFTAKNDSIAPQEPMFGGGCGGGANIKPIAFLVVAGGRVRLLPVNEKVTPIDRIIDAAPDVVEKVNGAISGLIDRFSETRAKKRSEKKEPAKDAQFVDIAE